MLVLYMVWRVYPLGPKLFGMPPIVDWETHNVIEYTVRFQCPSRFVLVKKLSHVAYIEDQWQGTTSLGTIIVSHAIVMF